MTPQEYKDKTIAACLDRIEKYRSIKNSIHKVGPGKCPFCQTYLNRETWSCKGCFQAGKIGVDGCQNMKTLQIDVSYENDTIHRGPIGNVTRARFHELAIDFLEKIDAQYFTPEGWKYEAFEEIRELDRKLAEGVIK